jgi:hypothetical protein
MNKLKILWKNKRTWVDAFKSWHVLMYPHLYDFPEQGCGGLMKTQHL